MDCQQHCCPSFHIKDANYCQLVDKNSIFHEIKLGEKQLGKWVSTGKKKQYWIWTQTTSLAVGGGVRGFFIAGGFISSYTLSFDSHILQRIWWIHFSWFFSLTLFSQPTWISPNLHSLSTETTHKEISKETWQLNISYNQSNIIITLNTQSQGIYTHSNIWEKMWEEEEEVCE